MNADFLIEDYDLPENFLEKFPLVIIFFLKSPEPTEEFNPGSQQETG